MFCASTRVVKNYWLQFGVEYSRYLSYSAVGTALIIIVTRHYNLLLGLLVSKHIIEYLRRQNLRIALTAGQPFACVIIEIHEMERKTKLKKTNKK